MARTTNVNGKRIRPKLTKEQRDNRRKRHVALAGDLATTRQAFAQEAVDLASKHGHTLKWTRTQLLLNSGLRERRRVNAWNAFLKEKLNEANSGREKGNRFKLTFFVAKYKTELLAEYRELLPTRKQALIAKAQAARDSKTPPARANPKAVNQAITASFSKMDREWTALCTSTGMEGFFIAVRGTVEDHAEPKIFFTEKAERFVRTVLDVEPRRLALRLESWVVSGIDLPATAKRQRTLARVISNCRNFVQEELDDILVEHGIKKNVKMNYTNYERQIVERYGVALTGWPLSGRVCNPAKIGGRQNVEKLLSALQSESCKWVKLTCEQLAARIAQNKARQEAGEKVYQPRRARGSNSGSTSKEVIDTDDDED